MEKCSFINDRNVAFEGKIASRFLTDDEELTELPSSIRQCSRLLHAEFFGPIINTSVF